MKTKKETKKSNKETKKNEVRKKEKNGEENKTKGRKNTNKTGLVQPINKHKKNTANETYTEGASKKNKITN